MKYYEAEVPHAMPNADRVHDFGLFVGNHHYPLDAAIEALAGL
jgi:CDP-6-deoxy-D-xylo-4-hexulose-3-dehydrase